MVIDVQRSTWLLDELAALDAQARRMNQALFQIENRRVKAQVEFYAIADRRPAHFAPRPAEGVTLETLRLPSPTADAHGRTSSVTITCDSKPSAKFRCSTVSAPLDAAHGERRKRANAVTGIRRRAQYGRGRPVSPYLALRSCTGARPWTSQRAPLS